MKTSWRQFYRRVTTVCLMGGAAAWSSAMCYAAQLAFDTASDPVYADGWQGEVTNLVPMQGPGDNGGFGFTPWNFNNDNVWDPPTVGIRSMDGPPTPADPMRTQSPFNQVDTAWRLGLNYAAPEAPDSWKDIVRVGRGLETPLQVGQTLSIVVDPPSENRFWQIDNITLTTGRANRCSCDPAPTSQARFEWGFFNGGPMQEDGRWSATSIGPTTLFNVDKAPMEHPDFPMGAAGTDSGLRLDFTLTGAESFDLTATPLDDPAKAFTGSGVLDNPGAGPIDWIEFLHWRVETPDPDRNSLDTDFFIRSFEITGPAVDTGDFDDDGDVDGADFLIWQRGLGTTAGAMLDDGDGNGDGDVDANDLALWKQQFDQTAGVSAAAAIPEPATFVYVLGAAAGLAGHALAARRR